MNYMADVQPETTPAGFGSLDEAANALGARLAAKPAETESGTETQPEQPTRTAEPTEQAPTAPEEQSPESETEQSKPDESTEDESEQPVMVTVKVDGKPIEVPFDEVVKGYSRTEDYTRKTMALAEERKALEKEKADALTALRAERDQYAALLPELSKALEALSTEPDWSKRALEVSPVQLSEEMRAWKDGMAKVQQVKAEQTRIQQQKDADAEKEFQSYVAQEQQKLHAALPDLADPEKAKTTWTAWQEYALKDLGFTPEQFAGVTDHRVLMLLDKAMRYDRQQAKAPAIKNKIDAKLKPAAPGSDARPQRNKAEEAFKRLRQSGSLDDAAAALGARINRA